MRVLVLHSELGHLRGGGENFTRNLFSAFAARGHSVTAVFAADRHGKYPFPLPPDIEPVPIAGWWPMALGDRVLSFIGRHLPPDSPLSKQWDRVREAISWRSFRWYRKRFQERLRDMLDRHYKDSDAVYVHGNIFLASEVARKQRTILRLPGPVSHEMEPLLRSVHAVCANGDALVRIRKFLGDHATELPVGLETELFKPEGASIRPAIGWQDHHCVIGYVGRLIHLKGVDLLAAAFKELSRTNANVRLLIVGNGSEEHSLRSILSKEFTDGIAYHRHDVAHEQLGDWYRAMDILVMPSRYENFSNTILEALACGVPFLASDVGGNKTLAALGAGILFEHGSVSSLTECLSSSCNARSDLKASGQAVSTFVRERYNWEHSAARLETIIISRLGVQA